MLTLALASFLGLTEFFGLGDEAKDFYTCSDPTFFITREDSPIREKVELLLKGTLHTAQPGYIYRFQLLQIQPPQAFAVISAGQPINQAFGRGLPAVAELKIEQRFQLPENVGLLRLHIEGITAKAYDITCDITPSVVEESKGR